MGTTAAGIIGAADQVVQTNSENIRQLNPYLQRRHGLAGFIFCIVRSVNAKQPRKTHLHTGLSHVLKASLQALLLIIIVFPAVKIEFIVKEIIVCRRVFHGICKAGEAPSVR